MNKYKALKSILLFLFTFIVLVGAYFSSAYYQYQQSSALLLADVKNRIALDLNYLNLPDSFFSHAGSEEMVVDYINDLNSLLGKGSAINLYAIENISAGSKPLQSFKQILETPQRSVELIFVNNSRSFHRADVGVVIGAMLIAFIIVIWWRYSEQQAKKFENKGIGEVIKPATTPILLIDLQSKSIANSVIPEKKVKLANKPLCFYLALIEFCIENPEVVLNQNKDVPEPLIELANKYFYRLIELGHTIRKRPNFTNSLEKTLSEIRAALDETLIDFPELKECYYPPKAHGEGSRSRLHSYGLAKITLNDIKVIGK